MGSSLTLRNKNQIFVSMMAISSFAILVTLTICSIMATSNNTKADSLEFSTDVSGISYITSVVSADNLKINLNATPRGDLAIAHDTINTKTDNPSGYQLYFSMNQSTDYDASHPGNALYTDGNTTSSNFVSAGSGSVSAPAELTHNTWGFALVGGANKQTGVPDTFSNFNDIYVDSNGNSSTGATHQTVLEDSKFAAVPLRSAAVKVQEVSEPTTSAGQNLDVYYAIKANNALPSGEYIGVVNYYALSDTPISNLDAIALSPSEISSDGGETLTIITSLYSSHVFTSQEVTITLTNKTNSSITGTCTLDSSTSATGNVVLTCTTPALEVGDYTVSVSIPSYGKSWSKDISIVKSGPAADPTFNITYMQEMTSAVCDAVTTPASASVTAVPEGTLIDYRGRDGTGTAENPVNDPTSSNYQTYKVRKLYDGNCWMAENLQLNLSTSHSYKVGTFAGGEADWTPNQTTSSNAYNYAITPNYKENIAVTDYRSISHNNWYYTWYAATAGQGTSDSNPSITQSICPKGWRLPLGTTANKSFYYLITTKYGQSTGNAINNDPLNFYPAGLYYSGSQYDTSYGYYWSASPYTSTSSDAYYLYFHSGSVYPQNYYINKYYGFSVRCVSL